MLWILLYFCSPCHWESSSCGYCFISAVHRTEAVRVHLVDTALILQSMPLRVHHVDTALFLQSTELKLWEFIMWILLYFCSPCHWESSFCGYCFISAVHRTERVHFVDTALFLQSTELKLWEFILWILLYFCSPWNQVHSSCGYCFISAVHLTERVHLVDTALILQSMPLRVHHVDTALFLQST